MIDKKKYNALVDASQDALACLENLWTVQKWDKEVDNDHIVEAIDSINHLKFALALNGKTKKKDRK